jgi:hypothetical protein
MNEEYAKLDKNSARGKLIAEYKKQFTTSAGHILVNDEPVAALDADEIDPTQIVKVKA